MSNFVTSIRGGFRGRGQGFGDPGRGRGFNDRGRGSSFGGPGRGGSFSDRGRGFGFGDRGRGSGFGDRGRGSGFGDRGRGSNFGDRGRGSGGSPSRQRARSPIQQIRRTRLEEDESSEQPPGSADMPGNNVPNDHNPPGRGRGYPSQFRGIGRGFSPRERFSRPTFRIQRDPSQSQSAPFNPNQPTRFQSPFSQNLGFRPTNTTNVPQNSGQTRIFNENTFDARNPVKLATEESPTSSSVWTVGNPWGCSNNKQSDPGAKSLLQPQYLTGGKSNPQIVANPHHQVGQQNSTGPAAVVANNNNIVRNPIHNQGFFPTNMSIPPPSTSYLPAPAPPPQPTNFVPNILYQQMQPPPLLSTPAPPKPSPPVVPLMSLNPAGFNNAQQLVNQNVIRPPLLPPPPAPKLTEVTPTTNAMGSGMIIKSPVSYNNLSKDIRYEPSNTVQGVDISKNFKLDQQQPAIAIAQRPAPAPVVVKPRPPPPPPPKISGIRVEPLVEPVQPVVEEMSYELKFIELSNSYNLEVKSSPSVKTDANGKKTFAFVIEFGNKFKSDSAEGQYFPSISEARESAYRTACRRVENLFSTNESQLGHTSLKKRPFRSQDSWPHGSEDDKCESPGSRPPPPKIAALLDSPLSSPSSGPSVPQTTSRVAMPTIRSKQPFENKFKDYMDVLHMQCWLKTKRRSDDRGNRLYGVEVEVQSYDKKFHQFDCGEYFVSEDKAKESAFECACRKLELMFPKELQEFVLQDTSSPNQRTFMDLRSTLGLSVRCLPEIKRGSLGELSYAFNIEFCRGGEIETVYGDFGPDEKKSKEKAFELATWRLKYLFGPELEYANNPPPPPPPPPPAQVSQNPDLSVVDWEPPSRQLYNPHYSGNTSASTVGQRRSNPSYAMISPRIQQPQTPIPPSTPSPDHTSHLEYNRTYEYRFKDITDRLNAEFFLRKIPKFEGGHKIFAFEITFQGTRGNIPRQQSMGEYFRDEGMAKESAFKYACEQINSRYDQMAQH